MSANCDQAEIMRRVQKEYREKAKATRRARLDSERIEWKCDQCGKAEMRSPHDKRRFCGNECSQEWQRTARVVPKFSPAREKTAEVVALYRDGLKAKPIAIRLAISPRIVREILIEHGVYAPKNPGNGKESRASRLRNLHSAMLEVLRKVGKREAQKETVGDLHAAMMRAVNRHAPCKSTGAPRRLKMAEYCAWRYKNDPQYRIRELLRQRMKKVIKRGQKTGSTLELLGCSAERVRAHIESQFKPGMNWNNGGTGKGKWHIDHRIPCASFNLTDKAQQRLCFHWTNLQPMWSIANMKKGRHLQRHEQTSLHISH